MSSFWIATIGASALAFALKYAGHSLPEKILSHPHLRRVNNLIPVALLAALVSVQTLTNKTTIALDHRLLGVSVAIVALFLKAPFPIVVLSSAISSAFLYNYLN